MTTLDDVVVVVVTAVLLGEQGVEFVNQSERGVDVLGATEGEHAVLVNDARDVGYLVLLGERLANLLAEVERKVPPTVKEREHSADVSTLNDVLEHSRGEPAGYRTTVATDSESLDADVLEQVEGAELLAVADGFNESTAIAWRVLDMEVLVSHESLGGEDALDRLEVAERVESDVDVLGSRVRRRGGVAFDQRDLDS